MSAPLVAPVVAPVVTSILTTLTMVVLSGCVELTQGLVSEDLEVRVFALQVDLWMMPRNDILVRYNLSQKFQPGENTRSEEVSVCYRVKPSTLTSYEVHISLALTDHNNDVLFLYRRGEHHGFYYNGVRQFGFPDFTTTIGLHQWVHYCHIFSFGEYRAYVQGEERARGPIATSIIPLPLNSTLTLGQEQDLLAGAYDVEQILRGHITQVNIWNRTISLEEVAEQAACKRTAPGNIFSTDKDTVEVFGAIETFVNPETFCKKPVNYVIFSEPRYLAESVLMCSRVGYKVYSPDSREDNTALHNESLQFIDTCSSNYHLWIGVTDEKEEGVWRKFSDNTVINPYFELGEPNGAEGENCMLMFLPSGRWVDTSCVIKWPACVPCQVSYHAPLRLRGLCFTREPETFYEVLGYKSNKPYFHGYYGMMVFHTGNGVWEIFDTTKDKQIAKLTLASNSLYPIGRHVWTLKSSICKYLVSKQVQLSLSVCKNSEFTCSNGDCILKSGRCDSKDDCSDLSDEDHCEYFRLPNGYRNERPPANQAEGQPIHLVTTVDILRFMDISDVRRFVSLEILVEMTWTDPRPEYLNLRDNMELNRLSKKDKQQLWTPELKFPNVLQGDIKLIGEEVFLRKVGNPQPADFNDVRMDTVYVGRAATLVLQQHYSGSFACSFDVFYYPFDTQRCAVQLQVSSHIQELVKFSGYRSSVVYLEDKMLPSYVVSNYKVHTSHRGTNHTRYSLLQVEFELTRRWMMLVMSVFMPTSLLLVIGYSTLFIKVSLLQVRLIVSLTTLLVLYTLFNNTSSALPVTAYVKMIDIWFFYCIFLLFFIIISHVAVEHLDNSSHEMIRVHPLTKENKKRKRGVPPTAKNKPQQVMKTLRTYVVPTVVLVFNMAYWVVLLASPKSYEN